MRVASTRAHRGGGVGLAGRRVNNASVLQSDPINFAPSWVIFSVVCGGEAGHIIFAPKDGKIMAYSARYLVAVLVVAPGPSGSVGWCSKSCTRIPSLYYRGLAGGPSARWGGVPKVAPEPLPYMVLRAVWWVAQRLDGVVFQKLHQNPPPCILLEA